MEQTPGLERNPSGHLKLYHAWAAFFLLEQIRRAGRFSGDLVEQFPFLAGYCQRFQELGVSGEAADERWRHVVTEWERGARGHLPLRALRSGAALDPLALVVLCAAGLIEEDARFTAVFELLGRVPETHHPTADLLSGWWQDDAERWQVRERLQRLQGLGLVQVAGPGMPRALQPLQVSPLLWDAVRGQDHEGWGPGLRYTPPQELPAPEDLILPEEVRALLPNLPALLSEGGAGALLVRGPRHNSRRALLGALARGMGRGLLVAEGLKGPDDERWQSAAVLATLLGAMLVAVLDLSPSESAEVPGLDGYAGPLAIALGTQGGVLGPRVEDALTLRLPMPGPEARERHWRRALGPCAGRDLGAIAARFRLPAGHIRRLGGPVTRLARLGGRAEASVEDVQRAARDLNRQALDALAVRLPGAGDWTHLAVSADTLAELRVLERRCLHRERLERLGGAGLRLRPGAGVRALFKGPSGTGKTLAAQLLGATLQKDVYRLELSAVVNKYIGETEKNLGQVFALAEELDVILLLDEGDALLTQRTGVQSANDRYANLETNYLLQRLEGFEGIILVTTNAVDHIDKAFQRRMDVVVSFQTPGGPERLQLLRLHLPAGHEVPEARLTEVAARCDLTGGQLRNVALHAALLALDGDGTVRWEHLATAVRREYQKMGTACPLRA